MITEDTFQYPIGKFNKPASYTQQDISGWINEIKELPGKLRLSLMAQTDEQLDVPYREGAWTIRQLVHHLADGHMNALLRFKWALTEDDTIVKPYGQDQWALLADYKLPVMSSLLLLDAVHIHLVALMESLNEDDINRTYRSSPNADAIPLKQAIALYAWHGNHHLAHIQNALKP